MENELKQRIIDFIEGNLYLLEYEKTDGCHSISELTHKQHTERWQREIDEANKLITELKK